MREQKGKGTLGDNLITGAVMLVAYLIVNALAPAMNTRWQLLIALCAGGAASLVIYLVKKRKKEKEEEEKLPPI